jgi:hypothetical protein
MDKIHLSNMNTFAIIMIAAGCLMVSFDLYRIYKFWLVKNWKVATGTVSGVARLGAIHIVITFTYSAFDGFTRQYKCSQTVPRDNWSENLSAGRLITIKYNPAEAKVALIQQGQPWSYIFFGVLNSLWILIGLLTLCINK